MSLNFDKTVNSFIRAAEKNKVKMILVGGGAVNFHGYLRHSADIDFWVDISNENLKNLLATLKDIGYELEDFPENVKKGKQNISLKISPLFELELITNFNPGKTFTEAFNQSILFEKGNLKYRILSFNDLINSKITTNRTKDKLDIEELQRIKIKRNKKD